MSEIQPDQPLADDANDTEGHHGHRFDGAAEEADDTEGHHGHRFDGAAEEEDDTEGHATRR